MTKCDLRKCRREMSEREVRVLHQLKQKSILNIAVSIEALAYHWLAGTVATLLLASKLKVFVPPDLT